MKNRFVIDNVDLNLSMDGISDVYRMNFNKIDRVIDFDKKYSIKFIKDKSSYKLFNSSNDMKGKDRFIDSLKSNYEFMSTLSEIFNLICKFLRPKSLDVSEIFGEGVIMNSNPLIDEDIRMIWTNEDRGLLINKLTIISIF